MIMKGTYKNLKKKIAFLMALSMTSSYTGLTTFAEEFSNQTTGTPSDDNGDSAEIPENTTTGIGAVEISFASVLTKAVNVEFTLSNETGVIQTQKAKNVLVDKAKVRFEDVPAGKYILTATSDKFAEYKQEVTVENNVLSSLSITAGVVKVGGNAIKAGENTENGTGSIGAMLIGDVDGDGDIDEKDKAILINNIESHPDNKETDLNDDGKTNLADLELFVDSYEYRNEIITSSIEKCVIIGKNDVSLPDSYLAAGSVTPDEMLRGEGELKLEPEKPNEPISEENPVAIAFKVDDSQKIEGMTLGTGAGSEIEEGYIDVTYIDENGKDQTIPVPVKKDTHYLLKESEVKAEIDKNGNIQLNLGAQVAVKKVKITVTSMANKGNIAAISEVKFLNDMESRIPEPDVEIPENLTAVPGSEKFSLKWNPCVNIMGYEVKVEYGGKTEVYFTDKNSYEVSRFNDDDLKNYKTYKVSVQSVNGAWSSGYSAPIEVTPQANKRPDKPDSVKAVEDYKKLFISWKEPKDAQTYSVYYKERDSEDEYEVISNILSTSCIIERLETLVEYEIYVKAHNEIGTSNESGHIIATPIDKSFAEMPRYGLINRDEKGYPGSSHIIEARRYGGYLVNSNVDEKDNNTTAWATVDGYGDSYYVAGRDDGGWGGPGNNGLTYTFDQEYTFNTIGVLTATSGIEFSKCRWWDSNGKAYNIGSGYSYLHTSKTDAKGRRYYIITLPEAVTTSKFQICLSDYWGSCTDVSEVYFYEYDELMDEVMNLYVDDLHTVLKDDVTQETIDALRVKVNTPDKFGEINPNTNALLTELTTAEKILKAEALSPAVKVHNGITTKDTNRGFSGLNAWQPLGITLADEEEITIYVGSNKKKTGEGTDLRLIITQYHSESDGVVLSGANLKVGANTIKMPKGKLASQENGGALYIQYQGAANSNVEYSVRISGGSVIPTLDLYKVTDEEERMNRVVEYITKLDEYVPTIEKLHNEKHKDSKNEIIAFDKTNCILGATDIMLDTMMYSLPASQILAGTGKGSVEERAETLLKSLDAMEDMMYLFYQHKGLNASATAELNQIPKGHLNIRYQRMFSGAFMYASGDHIGIEWGSSPAMAGCESVVTDENGKYVSGNYFGWGIAHEIGHCINQGTYAVAEITNNYFAQLAQAKDENDGMRFQYENIYKKVTSGTKGNCSNIATQLGMYWQLHLAYDSGMNFKTYSDYNEQLANLFYARVDTYSRNTKAAPKPGGIELTLNGNSDQNLMRLACAAANKNVLEFFEHWGKTPNEDTIKYAEQFEKETRAIYFANDDSRLYALNGSGSTLGTEGNVNVIKDVSVDNSGTSNKVNIAITTTDIAEEDILGYEIERCIITGGDVQATPVGFSQDGTFTDTVSTMNNRTVFYRVTLIDQYLNRSATFETKQVKIEHDGSMDKTNWTISVKGFEEPKEKIHAEEESYDCHPVLPTPEAEAIDFDLETVYTPHITDERAEITISFNQVLTATGLKYTAGDGQAIGAYEIYVYEENDWTLVSEGEFNGSKSVYFANSDGKYVTTYDTTDIKLVITGQQNHDISIAEIDVLGVTGDNVDFRTTEDDTTKVIGFIGDDYYYDSTDENEYIPKGSLMFTGFYKGNPAYNMVMLYDNKGNVVGGIDENGAVRANSIILADVPDGSNISAVTNGTWIYWIEPDELERLGALPEKVRVELYRVSDAKTNNGYRLVSDSLYETLPENLPTIMLTSENNKPQTTTSTTSTTETTTTATADTTTTDTENTDTTTTDTTTTTTTAFIKESSEAE
ncbi:MAG: fibronectin type III domain-containing protein [Ruminococcus sp.]|nr:fibronectin type III domain-containing protein [Ruminococcus sp.]